MQILGFYQKSLVKLKRFLVSVVRYGRSRNSRLSNRESQERMGREYSVARDGEL